MLEDVFSRWYGRESRYEVSIHHPELAVVESCLELNGILRGVVAGKNVCLAIRERQIQTLVIYLFVNGTLNEEHILNGVFLWCWTSSFSSHLLMLGLMGQFGLMLLFQSIIVLMLTTSFLVCGHWDVFSLEILEKKFFKMAIRNITFQKQREKWLNIHYG